MCNHYVIILRACAHWVQSVSFVWYDVTENVRETVLPLSVRFIGNTYMATIRQPDKQRTFADGCYTLTFAKNKLRTSHPR